MRKMASGLVLALLATAAAAQSDGTAGSKDCVTDACSTANVPDPAQAPRPGSAATPAAGSTPAPYRRLPDTYVEGDGYTVRFGVDLSACMALCTADSQCRMFEYYRPRRKCNIYSHTRASGYAPNAEVGVKLP